jgi:GNAT superfamily N-acetyltransferase
MKIQYQPISTSNEALLADFVMDLYADELGAMTKAKVRRTIRQLRRHPDQGQIIMFTVRRQVVGYAILIHFWSNEYSGTVLMLDELYVVPAYRSQGIATSFINYVFKRRIRGCVGMELEVVPTNQRAYTLYRRLGFRPHKNIILTKFR